MSSFTLLFLIFSILLIMVCTCKSAFLLRKSIAFWGSSALTSWCIIYSVFLVIKRWSFEDLSHLTIYLLKDYQCFQIPYLNIWLGSDHNSILLVQKTIANFMSLANLLVRSHQVALIYYTCFWVVIVHNHWKLSPRWTSCIFKEYMKIMWWIIQFCNFCYRHKQGSAFKKWEPNWVKW